MTHDPLSSGERRDGPDDRRLRERAPASDRRSTEGLAARRAASDDSYLNPPISADASAPAIENTQLLFERS
ncbi:MAG: hypothetical protein ABIX46_08520 [Burkholderiaceae bacterium]